MLSGIDGGEVALAFWGNQSGIAYDPAKIADADLPQTPDQFSAYWEAHPGQFGFNYENGGSGPSFYANLIRAVSGVDITDGTDTPERRAALQPGFDFFNQYADDYQITASNADSITRLSEGEFTMVAAWEDHLAGLQVSGEVRKDLKFYIPELGMTGGGNAVSIPLNAPHPAAALVFVNWLTSPDVQTRFNAQFGTAPMNKNADDSAALVSMAMRERQTPSAAKPFADALNQLFIEEVIQER
jgi:putative spermidine/putrescine transport system substrate-binding protein